MRAPEPGVTVTVTVRTPRQVLIRSVVAPSFDTGIPPLTVVS